MKYKVGQGVLYKTSFEDESRFELGIIIEVDPDVDKYPYRIIFASNDEDDDWYSSQGVDQMVEEYLQFVFKMHDENVKEAKNESANSR